MENTDEKPLDMSNEGQIKRLDLRVQILSNRLQLMLEAINSIHDDMEKRLNALEYNAAKSTQPRYPATGSKSQPRCIYCGGMTTTEITCYHDVDCNQFICNSCEGDFGISRAGSARKKSQKESE